MQITYVCIIFDKVSSIGNFYDLLDQLDTIYPTYPEDKLTIYTKIIVCTYECNVD